MEIKFHCSNTGCGRKLAVDEAFAGASVQCPECGRELVVPEAGIPNSNDAAGKGAREQQGIFDRCLSPAFRSSLPSLGRWAAPILVLACIAWMLRASNPTLPNRIQAALNEISSVGEFRKAPVANHADTRLFYARGVEHGLGIFLLDLNTLERRQIREITLPDNGYDYYSLLGFSPDDRYFLFSQSLGGDRGHHLELLDGKDGKLVCSLELRHLPLQAIWLSDESFVFLDSARKLFHASIALAEGEGPRLRTPVYLRQIERGGGSLTHLGGNQVAWTEKGAIWSLDMPTRKATQLSQFNNVTAEWLHHSQENGQFLFCWTDTSKSKQRRLYRFDPAQAPSSALTQITGGNEHTFNGRWILKGTGYSYVANVTNTSYLAVRLPDSALNTNLFLGGYVRSYSVSPSNRKLYAIGALGYEPVSIWEYDLSTKTLRNVASGLEKPFQASQIIKPIYGVARSSVGGESSYWMLPPGNFDRSRTYPVVIDGAHELRWKTHSQFLSNAGVFYVSVNRRSVSGTVDSSLAVRDTLDVHEKLVQNPNIDPKRVFIMGFSAGTAVVSELVEKHPELWRGALFLGPGALPDMDNAKKFPSLFVAIGDQENGAKTGWVGVYETAACRNGGRLKKLLLRNSGHIVRDNFHIRQQMLHIYDSILNH